MRPVADRRRAGHQERAGGAAVIDEETGAVTRAAGTWALSPYGTCPCGCDYGCHRGAAPTVPVAPAVDLAAEVSRRLEHGGTGERWVVGGRRHAYPTPEAEHRATRAVLEQLLAHGARGTVHTRSTLVLRDADVLRAAAGRLGVVVGLACLDDEVEDEVDGDGSSVAARLALVRRLRDTGIPVEVEVSPFLPGVTDVEALVEGLPPDVPVTVAPLRFPRGRHHQVLADTTYWAPDAWDAYLAAYERLGHLDTVSWLRPALAGGAAVRRLPRLQRPSTSETALRRTLRAAAEAEADRVPIVVGAELGSDDGVLDLRDGTAHGGSGRRSDGRRRRSVSLR